MNRRQFRDRVEWLRQLWRAPGPRNPYFKPWQPGPTTAPRPDLSKCSMDYQLKMHHEYELNVPYLDALPSWTWAHSIWPWIGEPREPMPDGRLDEEAFWLGKEQLWAMREDLA